MKQTAHFFKPLAAIFFALTLMFTACKKKEIQGPKGDPGTPGGGGNSNVTTIDPFLIASSLWIPDSAAGMWTVTVSMPAITKDIVDKGGVKMYQQVGTEWWELPYSIDDLVTQFGFSVGQISLRRSDTEGRTPPRPDAAYYRMVINTQSARLANTGPATGQNSATDDSPKGN